MYVLCARAGKDHPRVCGEHRIYIPHVTGVSGSSPRMRGAHDLLVCRYMKAWIIPAYAGSTRCRRHLTFQGWDHPRVCGEHLS